MSLNYIICTTPRSGSTFLCDGLSALSVLGAPSEWFIGQFKDDFHKSLDTECDESSLYQKIIATKRVDGVFALKIMYDNLQHYCRMCAVGAETMIETIQRSIGDTRFIFLTRRDMLMQAISFFKAKNSNVWFDYGQSIDNKVDIDAYDFTKIDTIYNYLLKDTECWYRFFEQSGIQPLHLVYEDVCKKYSKSMNEILEYLEIRYRGRIKKKVVGIRKMADKVSLQMKEQLIRDRQQAAGK